MHSSLWNPTVSTLGSGNRHFLPHLNLLPSSFWVSMVIPNVRPKYFGVFPVLVVSGPLSTYNKKVFLIPLFGSPRQTSSLSGSPTVDQSSDVPTL